MKLDTKDLKSTGTEQLRQEAKITKITSITLGIMLLVLLALAIYVSLNHTKMISLLVVPFALSPILFIIAKRKLLIKQEIESRGE